MKQIVYFGQDEETCRYLGRRLKSLEARQIRNFDEFNAGAEPAALAVIELDGDFGAPFQRVARELKAQGVPFIVVSSLETMKAAVQSMRLGAFDYFLSSDDRDEIVDAILRRLSPYRVVRPTGVEQLEADDVMVGHSQKIQEIFKLIGKIAQSSVSVLLRGESGTGKELVARQIHANSDRRDAPFVVIDCAAIPHDLVENELFGHEVGAYSGAGNRFMGKFDLANHGTVFLDEITELDLDLQSKILRVIQQGTFDRVGGAKSIKVDVRTIATTQEDLDEMVRAGSFRQDLFHRLNVIALHLPPLRERPDDIAVLVQHFVRKHGPALGIGERQVSADLMSRFERYHWPGNVRELENIVRRALLLERGPVLTPRFLEEFPVPGESPIEEDELAFRRIVSDRFLTEELNWKRNDVHHQMIGKLERVVLRQVLRQTQGNQVGAARLLGISRNTLRVKMATLGMDSSQFR